MKLIGIDLGTTNSCIYYLDDTGTPVLVRDGKGHSFFPSVVWSPGRGKERVVGHKAKARVGFQPPPVIAVKRKMGTDEEVMLGGELVSPVEVSTEILLYCKRLVEEITQDTVGGVVVTVPAYFDAAPKRDTRMAVLAAFFGNDEKAAEGRLELLLEPEAAAYAYTIGEAAERLTVLVYDLGGGTFDVTVLEKTPETGLAVLKFGGDPHLGGDNIDDRLASWITYLVRGGRANALDRILAESAYDVDLRYTVLQQVISNDVSGLRGVLRPEHRDLLIPQPARYDLELDISDGEDRVRIQKLKALAEDAKKQLTTQTEIIVALQSAFTDHAGDIVDIDVGLSRRDFNLLIGDMTAKTVAETLAVVEKSGLQPSNFDRVLLVGGSSRMPVVAEELRKIFSCPVALTDPDLIVARGGAIRAGALSAPPAPTGGLTLDYPRQTADHRINISGQLSAPLTDGQVYLTRDDGRESITAVDGNRFLLRGIEIQVAADGQRDNRFRLEVLDGSENLVTDAELSVLHVPGGGRVDPPPKITKPIRYLARSGFRVLFPENEPLPATKQDTCYRASNETTIRIPIYEGERFLRDLRIVDVDPSVNVGAEIKLEITIGKHYAVTANAVVVGTAHKANAEFQIERIKMPSVQQMEREKDNVLEEIDNGIAAITDPNKKAQFRRKVRKIEGEFTKASKANEPDSHHLFSLIGELKKVQHEVVNSHNFLSPPLEEFQGLIRVCRNLAGKLDASAVVDKEEVLKKVDSLETAGKDAWEAENQKDWFQINREAGALRESLIPKGPPVNIDEIPPEAIRNDLLKWLDEMTQTVEEKELGSAFKDEIEEQRSAVRGVDLRDEDAARKQLLKLMQKKVVPLDKRIKAALRPADGPPDDLPDIK